MMETRHKLEKFWEPRTITFLEPFRDFDNAILGVVELNKGRLTTVYDVSLVLKKLRTKLTPEQAIEYFEMKMLGHSSFLFVHGVPKD